MTTDPTTTPADAPQAPEDPAAVPVAPPLEPPADEGEKPTAEETLNSLTGYDEIAVSKAFGSEILDLADKRQTAFTRALVFVLMRRAGSRDRDAFETVMHMGLGDVQAHFREEELDPDDPETPAGEGPRPPAQRP